MARSTTTISASVPTDYARRLREAAKEAGISFSKAITTALEEWLDRSPATQHLFNIDYPQDRIIVPKTATPDDLRKLADRLDNGTA